METLSTSMVLYDENPPKTSGFPSQIMASNSFDIAVVISLNKLLHKQLSCWWMEMPRCSWHGTVVKCRKEISTRKKWKKNNTNRKKKQVNQIVTFFYILIPFAPFFIHSQFFLFPVTFLPTQLFILFYFMPLLFLFTFFYLPRARHLFFPQLGSRTTIKQNGLDRNRNLLGHSDNFLIFVFEMKKITNRVVDIKYQGNWFLGAIPGLKGFEFLYFKGTPIMSQSR